VTLSVAKIM